MLLLSEKMPLFSNNYTNLALIYIVTKARQSIDLDCIDYL